MSNIMRKFVLGVAALLLAGCAYPVPTTPPPAENGTIQVESQPVQTQEQPAVPEPEEVAQQEQSPLAALDGMIWNDLDRDGLQDLNEPGIGEVAVNLLTSTKILAGADNTDFNGAYRFQDLAPGDYYVTFVLPAGYVLSPQDQGENELVDSDPNTTTAETISVTLVAGENGLVWTAGMYAPTSAIQPDPGTVQPPPTDIEVCDPGNYPLGGISALRVNQLAADYCLEVFLWNHGFAIGRIPGGAGTFLAEVAFLEVFYQNTFVYKYDVPGETNSIQVCYAIPFGRQGQIYFFDFYGPRFGERTGQPAWEPLETTVQDGVACAVAQTSGAYALIGN